LRAAAPLATSLAERLPLRRARSLSLAERSMAMCPTGKYLKKNHRTPSTMSSASGSA
jgi:hypothetical protein